MELKNLPALTVLSDCVTIVEKDNVKIVRVIHEKATAGISLFGGHVVSYQPTGQKEVIWMSDKAVFDGKTALRGGIPVCWPWFGRIAAPAHGFARTAEWELVEHRENENGVIVELALFPAEESHNIWPHMFDVRLVVEIGNELKVRLNVLNIDDEAFTFSGALHTYLNVGGIEQTQTMGMGSEYIDSLKAGQVCQGGNVLQLSEAIDRIYTSPEAEIVVTDPVLARAIAIKNQGHNSAVLWNPWAQGAAGMADMSDDGYKTMLCVESTLYAPSLEQGKTLQPGEAYQLSTTICLR